jgi:hypothetical protein
MHSLMFSASATVRKQAPFMPLRGFASIGKTYKTIAYN